MSKYGNKLIAAGRSIFIFGIIGAIISAIIFYSNDYEVALIIEWLIVSSFSSWISSLLLKGFGELIENSAYIRKTIETTNQDNETTNQDNETTNQDSINVCFMCQELGSHKVGKHYYCYEHYKKLLDKE